MANSGVFTIDDINFLRDNEQFPELGQLQLIQTQTFYDVSELIFANMEESTYDTHFITYYFENGSSDVGIFARFGTDSSTFRDSNYHYGGARMEGNGSGNYASTTMWGMNICNLGTMQSDIDGPALSGYIQVYDLGNPRKYSMLVSHSAYTARTNVHIASYYGSASYGTAEKHTAFRLFPNTGSCSGKASLYGIRFG